ncbi:MAG: VCBS repeat-containing protein [Acidobacteriota bacterium]|nr:VCBS repeat-containing protein [Acidobacteriota bacterium]
MREKFSWHRFIAMPFLLGLFFVAGMPNANARTSAEKALDFDGDRRADFSVFRPSNNTFYIARSSATSTGSFFGVQFGSFDTDRAVPGDYDNDGKGDIAVWRETTGTFFVLRSSDNTAQTFQFGSFGDEPVQRDYDGDGATDFAVVRRTGGNIVWFIRNSKDGSVRIEQFGLDTDTVAPGDYDGDGKFDLAVFRGQSDAQATFFVRLSSSSNSNNFTATQFGLGSDLVVPGDYDNDGKTDFAVVRGGTPLTWFILNSSNGSVSAVQFGLDQDLITQGDYDGDGKTDISVFRQQTGIFYVLRSTDSGVTQTKFGQNGDIPLAYYNTH